MRNIAVASAPPPTLVFGDPPVLTITPDGRLEKGAGLSDDEMTQRLADLLVEVFPTVLKRIDG